MTNLNNYKLLVLPNNTLLCSINMTTTTRNQLVLFNSRFHSIKIIDKLAKQNFNITDMATNGIDRVYFTNYNDNMIYVCDLEFNLINFFKAPLGKLADEFYGPYGIVYSNGFLYIADCSNQRIKKMNSIELKVVEIYDIDFQAFELRCFGANNEMLCVKSDKLFTRDFNDCFSYYFYVLKGFQLVYKFSTDADLLLLPLNLNVYLFSNNLKNFFCFNSNGEHVVVDSLMVNFDSNRSFLSSSVVYFNNRFVFCDEFRKMFIFI